MTGVESKSAHIHIGSFHPRGVTPSLMRVVIDTFGYSTGFTELKQHLRLPEDEQMKNKGFLTYPQPEFLEKLYAPEIELLNAQTDDYAVKTEAIYNRFAEDYRKALSDANKAINNLIDSLGLPDSVNLRQEVSSTSEVMAHNMEKIYSPKYNDVIRYEMTRAHLLGLIALELNASKRMDRSQTAVSEFVDWLDNTIFSTSGKKIGETEDIDVYSLHEKFTLWNNGEVRLKQRYGSREGEGEIQKKNTLPVRTCILDGKKYSIYFNQRAKDDGNAVLKAIKKAQDRSKKHKKRIGHDDAHMFDKVARDILEEESEMVKTSDINDRIGAKLVVVEGDRDEFVKSLESRMKSEFGVVIDDSETNVDENGKKLEGVQSKRHTFARKKLPEYKNFEVIVYSLPEFLNSEFDLGYYNDGASHALYELQRLVALANLLFPRELYPNLDIELAFGRKLRELTEKLQSKSTIGR